MAGLLVLAPSASHAEESADGFLARFLKAYEEHLSYTGENPTPSPFRGLEPPLDSPPWPAADYPFGGSEVIGHSNFYGGPLTDALWASDWGAGLKDNTIAIYGWIEPGGNLSTARHKWSESAGKGGNYPIADIAQPNRAELDQIALYVERVPDEVQTDHVDWGFRITNLYGQDYRYTFAQGILSYQRLKRNHLYGIDPCIQCYGEIYIPSVAEGMNIRVGRYISVPDIEAQLAPNLYSYSHSMTYAFDPYSQTGIVGTVKLDNNWTVQASLSSGNDVTPTSRNAKLTGAVCVQWSGDEGEDVIYPCVNGINDQKYAYNNLQPLVFVWYHKFDAKWHMATEAWYMWERDTPNANWDGVEGVQTPPVPGANEAYCAPAKANCFAREYALVNFVNYEIDPLNGLSLRNEFFQDLNGQRTGIPTLYTTHMISWQHWIGDVVTMRPEVTFGHSYNHKAFDASSASIATGPSPSFPNGVALGSKSSVVILAADLILHF